MNKVSLFLAFILFSFAACTRTKTTRTKQTLCVASGSTIHALLPGSVISIKGERNHFLPDESFMEFKVVEDSPTLRLKGKFWSSKYSEMSTIDVTWINGVRVDIPQEATVTPEICAGVPAYELNFTDVDDTSYLISASGEKLVARRRAQPFKIIFDCKNSLIESSTMQSTGWFYFIKESDKDNFSDSLMNDGPAPLDADVAPSPDPQPTPSPDC